MSTPARLAPTMRSRKLQALDFINRYYARWGHSPSFSEIAAGLGVSKKRVHELVHQLSAEEQIRHVAGKSRGIVLIDRGEALSEAEVLRRLAALGWRIDDEGRTVASPLTEMGLHALPKLDHDPDLDIGVGSVDGDDAD